MHIRDINFTSVSVLFGL